MVGKKPNRTSRYKLHNKNYLLSVFIVFLLFVAVLLYSYIFKLGYLGVANYLFYFLVPLIILLNQAKNKDRNSTSLWMYLFVAFSYVLADKYFRLHLKLSKYFAKIIPIDPAVFVNTLYVIFFIIILSFFYKFLITEFNNNPDWLYLFAFAIVLKVVSIFSDLAFHDIIEDYFELFSLYFFSASFLLVLISRRRINK